MQYKKDNNLYILRFEKGEELLSSLQIFCEKEGIKGAQVQGIGAANHLEIGNFNAKTNTYHKKSYSGEIYEITSIQGNITTDKSHLHVAFALPSGELFGGHLFQAIINPTCEIFITKINDLKREKDPETNLDFLVL